MPPGRWSPALLLVTGCSTALRPAVDEAACDPRTLAAGEVRVRRVPCSDELMTGGEALRGDFLLENARLRAFFKSDHALSRHGGSGGTLVDLAPPETPDGLVEVVPLIGDAWMAEADLEPWAEGDRVGLDVTGVLPDGRVHTVTWTLDADAPTLGLDGADAVMVVPGMNAARVGDTLEARSGLSGGASLLYASDGIATDLGGWVRWDGVSQLHAGTRETVVAARWPERVHVSGETDGTAVSVRGAEGLLTRIPVRGGRFDAEVPAATTGLTAWKSGHEDSPTEPPGEELVLPVGAPGFLSVRAEDPDGRPLPATVWWGEERWWTGTGGVPLGVGPGTRDLTVSAGPRYSIAALGTTRVRDAVEIAVVLEPAHHEAALADLSIPAWPDPSTRRSSSRQLGLAAARGARFAVTTAADEIPDAVHDADTARFLTAFAGSHSPTADHGTVAAWPWSRSARRPAHGAADWRSLDASDVLALHADGGSRFTVVEPAWLDTAGPVFDWAPAPDAVRLSGPQDLERVAPALDAGAALGFVGPWTWLAGAAPEGPEIVASERALHTGATVAGNGPWIEVDVLGLGPGAQLDAPWMPVSVRCSGPDWMPISHARIIGDGGIELARFEAQQATAPQVVGGAFLPAQRWMVAVCEGDDAAWPELLEPAWAVSSPLYGPD